MFYLEGQELSPSGEGLGKYKLKIMVSYTDTAVKIKPYIHVIEQPKKNSTVYLTWGRENGRGYYQYTAPTKSKSVVYADINPAGPAWQSYAGYELDVNVRIGDQTDSIHIVSQITPPAPKLRIERKNDNRQNVTVYADKKGAAVLTGKVKLERQTDYALANWETITEIDLDTVEAYSRLIIDQTTTVGHKYRYRVSASNSVGSSNFTYSGWVLTTPPAPSNVSHIRIDNTQNRIIWSRNTADIDRGLVAGYVIERSTDGGVFTQIRLADPGSITDDQASYTDATCSTDHYYSYRIRSMNPAITSQIECPSEEGTAATYNTPSSPDSVYATFTSNGTAILNIVNNSPVADELEIHRSSDGGATWESIGVLEGLITSYEDTNVVIGEDVMYRVRNGRKDMQDADEWSGWRESNICQTLQIPDAPVLITPYNGAPVDISEPCRLYWIHTPLDGTEQIYARIRYRKKGTTAYTYKTVGTQAYYDLDISGYSGNDEIEWSVQTKGQHATASNFAANHSFKCITKPAITWTAPAGGATVTNLPVTLQWNYNDQCGTINSLVINVLHDGEVLKQIEPDVGTGESGAYSYTLSDILLDNQAEYQLQLICRSTSGLTCEDNIGIYVNYVPVVLENGLFPDVVFDPDTGYAAITLSEDIAPTGAIDPDNPIIIVDSPVADTYLYRVHDNKRTLIGEHLQAGETITDKYAPLNTDFTYELLMIAENGQIALVEVAENFYSIRWFVYWAPENVVYAVWEPEGDMDYNRPEKAQIRYSGRRFPVSYDSNALEQKTSFSAILTDDNDLALFRQMITDGGQGVWKSCDGDVFKADFELSYTGTYKQKNKSWNIKLDVTRIDSEDL